MAKYPVAGRVKTRLAASVRQRGWCDDSNARSLAASINRRCLEQILVAIGRCPADVTVAVPDEDIDPMRRWLGVPRVVSQGTGTLGARMRHVFYQTMGERPALMIGSDLPTVDDQTIRTAAEALRNHDCVLGPAVDGGYWLIGLTPPWRPALESLFDGIAWSTSAVMRQTLDAAKRSGLRTTLLDRRDDIDDVESLLRMMGEVSPQERSGWIDLITAVPRLDRDRFKRDCDRLIAVTETPRKP